MRSRPSFGYALLVALVAAATTWAALMAWRGFLTDSRDYLAPLMIIAVVIASTGAILRWIGSPAVVTVAAQVLVGVAMLSSELSGSPLPFGAAGDDIRRSLELAMESARTYAAPIEPNVPSVAPLLLVGGVFFLLLVDFLACTLRRVPVAGLGLLAIYSVPAGLVQSGPGVVAFLLAAVGFLALLHLDSREQLLKWGRPLGPDEHNPWTDGNPMSDAMRVGTGRIGAVAVVCALLLPPLIPVLELDLLGFGPGDGDNDIEIHNPRTDLRRDLEREADTPLIRVRTDDPDPDYLRVAVLHRFTGDEWSSGDRKVDDYPTGTTLPEPDGLSPEVPRTPYTYAFEATDQFDSWWLPTQFPATSVDAEGNWGYDPNAMDFIAVPEDLTAAGLDWQVTGLELEYGTDGEYFQDSAIDAVDDELLMVPDGLPPIVRSQALEATNGARTDYQAALLLQDWFRETGGFRYSLERAPSGMGADAFETFLSDTAEDGRRGYCEQFASAMAVMARMLGIPARVAVGFLEPTDLGNGEWEYSSHDLHAWPELYFEGAGWARFEPTPDSRVREDVPDYTNVPVTRNTEALPTNDPTDIDPPRSETATTEVTTTVPPEDQSADGGSSGGDEGIDWLTVVLRVGLALLVLAVLVALARAPQVLRRRQRRQRLAGSPEDIWDELRATAVDLDLAWPAGRSPQEVGRVLVNALGSRIDEDSPERPRTGPDADPDAAAALERLVAALELARYARPGTMVPPPGLGDDALTCCASLEAGVTRRTALRAKWLPRSVWQRAPRSTATKPALGGV
ncbi:DUF3488 and transglutaminase-like domain-containing protein [Nocardioides antri]|uniref:Transglutaminase domain-containing protein n=1 Tax=Nocardioides antri TaxID=2607659 RepID=A0A5B1M8X6_9ACTN|nr:DUF3488 and transglutaminase-like domain-containing protein [Nocardioides antri]KAA1428988.1 transglutaminase domain-containing protein [Nocardioides antri]